MSSLFISVIEEILSKRISVALIAAALTLNSVAFGDDDIQMEEPDFSGSGCAAGTVRAVLSRDKRVASILFDNYTVESGGETGYRVSEKRCDVLLGFKVPPGFHVAVTKVEGRGFNSVPAGAYTLFSGIFQLLDARTRRPLTGRVLKKREFRGPVEGDFTATAESGHAIWSECGNRFVMKIETRVLAETNRWREPVLASLDSLDATTGAAFTYHLDWRRCEG